MIAVSSGDCKIHTKWDQAIRKIQIILFLLTGGTPTLLATMCFRAPWGSGTFPFILIFLKILFIYYVGESKRQHTHKQGE